MRLRPHHLLCTQAYAGRGYDAAFVQNMTALTRALHTNPHAVVDIVFAADDVCAHCPHRRGTGCTQDSKVRRMDALVRDVLHLREESYAYHALVYRLRACMTPNFFDAVCSSCSWCAGSGCKDRILPAGRVKNKEEIQL